MKKNFNKNVAFTMVEAFICLVLIGLLFVSTISHVRIKDNYNKLYWSAYNTLLQAVGNIELEWNPICACTNTCSYIHNIDKTSEFNACWAKACWSCKDPSDASKTAESENGGSRSPHKRNYPSFLFGDEYKGNWDGEGTDQYFCKRLTAKINTILEDIECQHFLSLDRVLPPSPHKRHEAFTKAFEFKKLFPNDEPSFVSANGQRFYISRIVSANVIGSQYPSSSNPPPQSDEDVTYRNYYRFVVVDLNGNKGPNSQFRKGHADPDLVLFAINAYGNVIPLGIPEFDKLYLDAQVYYPDGLKSSTMTLFEAKAKAWGANFIAGMTDKYLNQVYIKDNGLAQSHVFYHNAINCAVNGYEDSYIDLYPNSKFIGALDENAYHNFSNGGNCLRYSGDKIELTRFVDPLYAILVTQFLFNYEDCEIVESNGAVDFKRTSSFAKDNELCLPYNNFSNITNNLSLESSKGCMSGLDARQGKCSVDVIH